MLGHSIRTSFLLIVRRYTNNVFNTFHRFKFNWCISANQLEEPNEDIYGIEINASRGEDEDGVDEETENEQDDIGPSEAMKELLRVLEFNAIDMYRLAFQISG